MPLTTAPTPGAPAAPAPVQTTDNKPPAKGKKGKASGRGPTPPKIKGGLPPGLAGMPGMGMPAGRGQLPSGTPSAADLQNLGLDFDLSKLQLPKK